MFISIWLNRWFKLGSATLKNNGKAFAIFLFSLALTFLIVTYLQQNDEKLAKIEFVNECDEIAVKVDVRMHVHAQLLRSASALFAASDEVSRKDWKAFYENLKIEKNLSGIQGIGFSLIIPANQLPQHIAAMQQQGFADYTVKPAGNRELFTSIIYLEPFAGRNLRAFGYDMFSEPIRRKAMELARDSNLAMLSGKVVLIQETNKDVQTGMLMYVPVYRNGWPANTVAQRRAAIIGWVYSPYRMNDLMQGILGRWDAGQQHRIHLQVYDDTIAPASLLYNSQVQNLIAAHSIDYQTATLPVSLNGKKWQLFFSLHDFAVPYFSHKNLTILIAGILLSVSIFLLFLLMSNTRSRALRIAKKLTGSIIESEAKFKVLFEGANDAIYILEGDKIIDCNTKTALLFKSQKENLIGHTFIEFSPLLQADGELSAIDGNEKINKTIAGEPQFFEWKHQCTDGTFFDAEVSLSKVVINENVFVQAVVRDITERNIIKKALQIEKQRLASILTGTNAGTWEWNIQTGQTFFNERWANMIGYTLAEIEPVSIKTWEKFTHPDDLIRSDQLLEKHFNGELDYYECEARIKHKKGHWVWILDRGSVNRWDAAGKPLLMYGTHQDITDRKQAEEINRESEKRFRLMADYAPVLIWTAGTDTLCNYFNKTWLQFTGRTMEQEMGNGWAEGVHPDDFNGCLNTYQQSFKAQQEFKMEYRLRHADGTYRWLLDNGVPRFTADGNLLGYIGSCIDIDDRKKADISKQSALNLLQNIAARVPGVVYQYKLRPDGSSCFPYASEAIYAIYRVTPQEVREDAAKVFANIHPDDLAGVAASIQISAKDLTPWQYQYRVKFTDGVVLWLNGNALPQMLEDGAVLWHGLITDITEQKKMEELTQEKAIQLKVLSDNLSDTFFYQVVREKDGTMKFVFFSKNAERFTGKTQQEIIQDPTAIYSMYNEEEGKKIIAAEDFSFVNMTPFILEVYSRNATGDIRWQLLKSEPRLLANGNTIWDGICTDITERKKAEMLLEKYAAELKNSNADLENFAYIASHDLQEPLRMVSGFLNLLEKKLGPQPDDSIKQYIHYATDGAARMKILISDLLKYSRLGANKDEFEAVDLNEMMAYISVVLNDTIEINQAVITIPPLPVIFANKTLINELFVNLLTNALKYRGEKDPVITVGYTKDANQFTFYVTDNGIGIAAGHYKKIFEIFQRLHGKGEYSGTGIGLALCKRIVEIHIGEIWVTSQEGTGSTFYFSIPIING